MSKSQFMHKMPLSIAKEILFGPFKVTTQVFYLTAHSFAFVNLKPIVPGHVLVSPVRNVPRLRDLTATEVADLFQTVQRVSRMVERVYGASALNVALQDGPVAGQTVPHVHAHIIPRKPADFERSDQIYEILETDAGDVGGELQRRQRGEKLVVDADDDRKPRTLEDMEKEATHLADEMEKET